MRILVLISKFLELWLTPSGFQLIVPGMMIDDDTAAILISRLGNPTRLKIVRELVRAGRSGMSVGEIQSRLGIPNSTLSHHINLLRSVDLIRQQRESTILRCFVNYDRIEQIVRFLTEECCAAEVEIRP